jgi:hypothetical protein
MNEKKELKNMEEIRSGCEKSVSGIEEGKAKTKVEKKTLQTLSRDLSQKKQACAEKTNNRLAHKRPHQRLGRVSKAASVHIASMTGTAGVAYTLLRTAWRPMLHKAEACACTSCLTIRARCSVTEGMPPSSSGCGSAAVIH